MPEGRWAPSNCIMEFPKYISVLNVQRNGRLVVSVRERDNLWNRPRHNGWPFSSRPYAPPRRRSGLYRLSSARRLQLHDPDYRLKGSNFLSGCGGGESFQKDATLRIRWLVYRPTTQYGMLGRYRAGGPSLVRLSLEDPVGGGPDPTLSKVPVPRERQANREYRGSLTSRQFRIPLQRSDRENSIQPPRQMHEGGYWKVQHPPRPQNARF